jgi:hypothetical protein
LLLVVDGKIFDKEEIGYIQLCHADCLGAKEKKKIRGFGPLANYADRATAACWRSSANFCG